MKRKEHTRIWVTFDKVGFHKYPNAPDEVAYLRLEHRHVFKFKVGITVFHDDREIEFHMFKNWLVSLYDVGRENRLELDYQSCEMMARFLMDMITSKYDCSARKVMVEVSEDGECGAVLESEPSQVFYAQITTGNDSHQPPGQELV